MKYIDADRLRAEIERRFWDYGTPLHDDEVTAKVNEVLSIIDSLQEEQPDFPTTDEQVKEFLATHPKTEVPEKYKSPDWLFKNQEQPEVDLEEEINRYLREECSDDDEPGIHEIAEHFADWGYLRAAEKYNEIENNRQRAEEDTPNDLEEAAKKYATEWHENPDGSAWKPYFEESAIKAFIAGADWQKEQMMKAAVEGTVMDFSSNQPRPQVDVLLDPHKYHTGDKVRIIIVKED